MRTIVFTAALLLLTGSTFAQSLSGPESVERNSSDLSYFVSNTGTGEIVKLLPDGTVQSFASGFTAGPHGLELIGDSLYACDGGVIRIVNRNTGALINTISIGGSFLNGITHKNHQLYFTDFSAKKIYRLNTKTNQFNVFVNALSKTPNGIVYDNLNDRLVFVCWGSAAPVYEVDLYDSTTTLLTTTALGNCDGIAMDCTGNFFISAWSPSSAVHKFNSTFSSSSSLGLTGLMQPADIYFDKDTDTLAIPNSGNNTVSKSFQPSCILGTQHPVYQTENLRVFPNPANQVLSVTSTTVLHNISVYSLTGKLMVRYTVNGLQNTDLNISTLPLGSYVLHAETDAGTFVHAILKF